MRSPHCLAVYSPSQVQGMGALRADVLIVPTSAVWRLSHSSCKRVQGKACSVRSCLKEEARFMPCSQKDSGSRRWWGQEGDRW